MDTKDYSSQTFSLNSQTVNRIIELCSIILVNEDSLDFNKAKNYIEEHINNDIKFQGDKYGIRHVVLEEIKQYIERCPSEIQIFIFDSDSGLLRYRRHFKNYYSKFYYTNTSKIEALAYPVEFEEVFDCIQEAIDSYTLYKNFSIKLEEKIQERVQKSTEQTIQTAIDIANIKAKNAATKAATEAVKQVVDDKSIEKQITDKIDENINEQMNDVTKQISETSVTILGIFAGIVLTVVAGLFYSSSVLDNVSSANYCRLISVSALVGFVCYSLIALMFRYIERIKYNKDNTPRFNKLSFVVDCILLIIMIIFGVLQYYVTDDNTDTEKESVTNNNEIKVESTVENSNIVTGADENLN